MTNEQKLRELAEAATPGPWSYEDDSSFDDGHNVMSGGYYIAECFDAAGDQHEYKTADKNAAWIAAANPSAILTLLDELATLRSERTAWRVSAENAESAVKQARIDALEEARNYCDELATFLACHQDSEGEKLIDSVRDSIEAMKETP